MDNKTALTIIEEARKGGALIYSPQNIECPPLYKVEPSIIEFAPKDFHDKEVNGKLLPRKAKVDKVSEAAGISFIQLNNEHSIERMEAEPALDLPARSVFIAHAQGKVRLPDGSWRTSTVETYAFDYVARAFAEEPTDQVKQKRKLQEYYKAGAARAATGARLRVIRQLTGMPEGFDPQEMKACGGKLVFSRIIQNTDYILGTHEGKMMAIAMATGASDLLYGKQRPTAPEKGEAADPAEDARPVGPNTVDEDEDEDFPPAGGAESAPADPAFEKSMGALVEWASSDIALVAGRAQRIIDSGVSDPKILEPALEILKYLATNPKTGKKTSCEALDMLVLDPIVLAQVVTSIRGIQGTAAAARASA